MFYSSWSYVITLSVFVLVTAMRNKFPCSLQFAAFIECHPQPSYVSTAVGLSPVSNLQALSAWQSIRDHTSTFCCARLTHTCKCRGMFCQIAEFLLKIQIIRFV